MDTFGFSLLPAAAEAGLDTLTVSRHMPLFRRVVDRGDTTLALATCALPDRLVAARGLLFLLTRTHLVVTRHRRLHVAARLADLAGASWRSRPLSGVVDLRFQHRGRDHHLWVRPSNRSRLESLLGQLLRNRVAAPEPAEPAPAPAPAGKLLLVWSA